MKASELYEGTEAPLSKAQMDFIIHQLQQRPIDDLNFEVVKLQGKYAIIENSSKVIVYVTYDEDEADSICDHFNHDKDVGKDSLIQSLITNRKKYNI